MKIRSIFSKRWFYFIALLFVALTAVDGLAAKEKENITMDFDNADIRVVIKFISELTGKNIIVDSKVKGNVTVISPTKITVSEAYKVFQSILEVNGYAAVESKGIIKIVHKPNAAKSLSQTRVGKNSKKIAIDDRIITQIVPLDYALSTQVRSALAPLISKNGIIIDYPATNTMIITDISSNIHRLIKIVQEIDLEEILEKIEVIALEHAMASDLSKQLTTVFPIRKNAPAGKQKRGGSRAQAALKFIPYERTNSIIVVAGEDALTSIKNLITILDVETEVEKGSIHVYYLNNAVAEDISKVLGSMVGKRGKTQASIKGGTRSIPLTGDIIIMPDKSTNALVITASQRDYKVIASVIEKLDIRRKQVYVEATIMEIGLDRQRELGVEFRATTDPAKSTIQAVGGTSLLETGINQLISNPFSSTGQGLVVGAVDGTFTFGGNTYFNIPALLKAIETESGVNILSTPHLLTTDNEEAEIIVGENVPFVTSRSETSSGNPITTIERKDVGIKLKITPQINESDFVKLKIYQEISSIKETQLQGATDLITTKRSARTTVVAKNNQTIAIGGLISDVELNIASKVPCLGDIPLLGVLFRSTEKKKEKKNLLIFLTPRIIRDSDEIERITKEKMRNMELSREGSHPTGDNSKEGGDREDEPEQ